MKVIVFGGSGFLGSHVADALDDAGHDVTIYDLKRSPYLRKSQKMIVGDCLDEQKVLSAVKGKEVVYNFSGIADIEEACRSPFNTIKTNIIGNTIILEASVKTKVKRFVFASSMYVYSKYGSFYRSSKQSCELLIENYSEAYGLPYTILRYGSLYGPRADERNFIYRIIKQAFIENKISRHGDGEELREYIHVHDAARGSVEILAKEFANQNVIISGNQQMRIRDFLYMIKEMFDNKIKIEFLPARNNPGHYEITPYTFAPKIGKKLTNRLYFDLNQGILDMIYDMHKRLGSEQSDSRSLRRGATK